jgi:hypothetical protein
MAVVKPFLEHTAVSGHFLPDFGTVSVRGRRHHAVSVQQEQGFNAVELFVVHKSSFPPSKKDTDDE